MTETEKLKLPLHFQVLLSCGNSYETEAYMVFTMVRFWCLILAVK